MKRIINFLRVSAFVILTAGVVGFGAYSGQVAGYKTNAIPTDIDAIVILTGGAGRLSAGGELLRLGRASQLLISGVHASVTASDIRTHTGLSDSEFDCCVTLGRDAHDTVGNALETAVWAQANGYHTVIVVTSDYHLPRSLIEMEKVMPGVKFIPYPVETLPPWQNPDVVRLWVQEYAKYAAVWVSHQLSGNSD
jgi:uncharacterized SAM-binding protein YcdF (DUF218 family)